MMNVIGVPIDLPPWHIVNPTVVRYLEQQYVEKFFGTGELRVPSCKAFWKHRDEQRGDEHESLIRVIGTQENGGKFDGLASFASDSFVLSTSCVEDLDIGRTLSDGYNAAIRIVDPVNFAIAIARKLPGYKGGYQGFCRYRDSRTLELEEPVPNVSPPSSNSEGEAFLTQFQSFLSNKATFYAMLQKGLKYRAQNEYRFVWNSFEAEKRDYIDLSVPDARQFCRRVTTTPPGPDLTSNWEGAQVTMLTRLPDDLSGTPDATS